MKKKNRVERYILWLHPGTTQDNIDKSIKIPFYGDIHFMRGAGDNATLFGVKYAISPEVARDTLPELMRNSVWGYEFRKAREDE